LLVVKVVSMSIKSSIVGLALIVAVYYMQDKSVVNSVEPVPEYSDRLTKRQIMDILSEYDVLHVTLPSIEADSNRRKIIMGVSDIGSKKIVINNLCQEIYRPYILLHEMYHIKHSYEGKTQSEKSIDSLALLDFKELHDIK
jgi:hypothetical protein